MRRKFWNVFGFYRDIVNTRDAGELLIGVFVEPGDGHVADGAGVWRRRRPRDRACCGRSDVDDDRLGHRVDISATVAPARRLRPAAAVEAHRLARAQFRRRWRRRRWGDVSSWIYYRSRWRRRGAHVALRSLLDDSPGLYAYCCTLMSTHKSQKTSVQTSENFMYTLTVAVARSYSDNIAFVPVFTARCYASAVLAMALCLSVRLSVCLPQVGVGARSFCKPL